MPSRPDVRVRRPAVLPLTALLALPCVAALAAAQPPATVERDVPRPGTKVRFVLADPYVQFGHELYVRAKPPQEGRLVAIDDSVVTVRVPGRGQFAIPASGLRALEARSGPGACRALIVRGGCAAIGGLLGAFAFPWLEQRFGGERTRPMVVRGIALGALFGGTAARDRWTAMPGWPRG